MKAYKILGLKKTKQKRHYVKLKFTEAQAQLIQSILTQYALRGRGYSHITRSKKQQKVYEIACTIGNHLLVQVYAKRKR